MATVTLGARLVLALVFATSALTKLASPSASRVTFEEFGAGAALARIGSVALAPAELAVAVGLALVPTTRWAAIGAVLLLLIFVAGIVNALRQGRTPDCGCFGAFRPTPIGRSTLIRNGALMVVAGFVAVAAPGPAVDGWISTHSAVEVLVAVLVVAAALAAVVFGSPALGARSGSPGGSEAPVLLELGQSAPSFRLHDTRAQRQTLRSLQQSGSPLVLVFGSSTCGSCTQLFPHLSRWRRTVAERVQIALVVGGDAEAARLIAEAHGLDDVLADATGTVSRAYGITANPSAFAVSADGKIANGPAIGQDAIEELIRLTLRRQQPIPTTWVQTTQAA